MTTESERAERIRKLQERRAAARPAAPTPADTLQIDRSEIEREERIQRLKERRRQASTTGRVNSGDPELTAVEPSRPRGSGSVRRRNHRAEASRVFAVGAGVTLTFSLMALMAKADESTPSQPIAAEPPPSSALETPAVSAATTPAEVTALAPATTKSQIPVILAPVQVRTRIVHAPGAGGGSVSRGGTGGGGGTPIATPSGGGGGTTVVAPTPPPPPPPPPANTSTNGSG